LIAFAVGSDRRETKEIARTGGRDRRRVKEIAQTGGRNVSPRRDLTPRDPHVPGDRSPDVNPNGERGRAGRTRRVG